MTIMTTPQPSPSIITTTSPDANNHASLAVHRMYLPGCFVVAQGIPGDGLANSVDTWPDMDYQDNNNNNNHNNNTEEGVGDENYQNNAIQPPSRPSMSTHLEEDHFRHFQRDSNPNNNHNAQQQQQEQDDDDAASDVLRASETASTATDAASLVDASVSENLGSMSIMSDHPHPRPSASVTTSGSSQQQQQQQQQPSSSMLSTARGLLLQRPQQQTQVRPIMLNNPNAVTSGGLPVATYRTHNVPARRPPEDSFVVIPTDRLRSTVIATQPSSTTNTNTTTTTTIERRRRQGAIRQWKQDCRQRQYQQRRDWRLQEQHQHQQQQESQRQQQQGAAAIAAAEQAMFLGTPTTPTTTTTTITAPSTTANSISSHNTHTGYDNSDGWWLDTITGQLAMFDALPRRGDTLPRRVVGSLAPGSTVVGTALWTLDSETLTIISQSNDHHPNSSNEETLPQYHPPCIGCIQVLQLESPQPGFCVYSVNGYSFLLPGIANAYVDPTVWWWRVTCSVGAFVREGLDLSSNHVHTIPYGSLVRVTRKTVNQQGLSRLRVHAWVPRELPDEPVPPRGDHDDPTSSNDPVLPLVEAQGWCSEFLNPLSGQRGYVVQPLPFPVPATYRVTLAEGAVIRASVELSSPRIGQVPCGATVKVVGRAFSEHPQEKCLERLQLAGGDDAGWISVRLNKQPPQDSFVVELVGAEGSFDPNNPGEFHWQAQQRVRQQRQRQRPPSGAGVGEERSSASSPSAPAGELSSIDDTSGSAVGSASSSLEDDDNRRRSLSSHGPCATYDAIDPDMDTNNPNARHDERCLICLTEERNATIVHGETGHIACCLVCARILKARGDKCPVCRLTIDSIIQHFWA